MKKALAFFTFLFPILIFGQTFVIPQPKIWLRADSIQTSDSQWRDVSGNNIPATIGDTQLFQQLAYLNYDRSLLFTDNQTIGIDSLLLDSKDMTVIIVYKTDSLDEEQSLWKLTADTNSVGLTSQKINGSDISIKYKDNNKQGVIINSLTQSIEMTDSVYYSSFQIGNGYDESLNGKVSEFLFFNRKLSNPEIIQQMSYLTIKYGVTLQKTDYLASDSTTIWNYTQYPDYSAFVLGIGRDDVMGLNQKQSKGIEDQIIMGLIIHAGDAKSHIYMALEHAKKGELVISEGEIQLAETALNEAHNIQSSWLAQEARGEGTGLSALFVHAQDHLMTTITEIHLIKEVIETRQELNELKKLMNISGKLQVQVSHPDKPVSACCN